MANELKYCPECGGTLGANKICEKCGFDVNLRVKESSKVVENVQPQTISNSIKNPDWPKYEKVASEFGKWAWIIGLISGTIYFFLGIWGFVWESYWSAVTDSFSYSVLDNIWNIISGAITTVVSIVVVKPRFSDKCADMDWDFLLNDTLKLGSIKIPWMFVWAAIMEIFGHWWAGVAIIVPTILLVFVGAKPYNWKS